MTAPIRALFFDTAGTLWYAEPDPVQLILDRCRVLDLKVGAADIQYQRARLMDELRPRFSKGHCTSEEQNRSYWQDYYGEMAQALAVPADETPGLVQELLAAQFDTASYRIYADVVPILTHLKQNTDWSLGVLSNGDGPDSQLLQSFGLMDVLPHRLIASEVGAEKPDSLIFELAAERCGIGPESLVYVGDDLLEDMTGALVAGCQAVLMDRPGRFSTNYLQWQRVRDLAELERLLLTSSAVVEREP